MNILLTRMFSESDALYWCKHTAACLDGVYFLSFQFSPHVHGAATKLQLNCGLTRCHLWCNSVSPMSLLKTLHTHLVSHSKQYIAIIMLYVFDTNNWVILIECWFNNCSVGTVINHVIVNLWDHLFLCMSVAIAVKFMKGQDQALCWK